MDTTEKNIKMCEMAKEIQGAWEPKDGDYAWHPDDGADYMGQWEFPAEVAVVKITEQKPCEWWFHWLWLPRQDQLQEMVDTNLGRLLLRVWKFVDQSTQGIEAGLKQPMITSMEQLWLVFVMRGEYGKVWNGEDWVKN